MNVHDIINRLAERGWSAPDYQADGSFRLQGHRNRSFPGEDTQYVEIVDTLTIDPESETVFILSLDGTASYTFDELEQVML